MDFRCKSSRGKLLHLSQPEPRWLPPGAGGVPRARHFLSVAPGTGSRPVPLREEAEATGR